VILVRTPAGVESNPRNADELVRRIVFNVLIGNADMHLKNWSLIYPDKRRPPLSPACDLVSTIAYLPDDNFALRFARMKRFDEFTTDELKGLVGKAGLPEHPALTVARDTVDRFLPTWEQEKSDMPLTAAAVKAIDEHLGRLPVVAN
jgi:serine/threonine-protein kinase HipA